MSHGIQVWDSSGRLSFSDQFLTFRVVKIVQVRGGRRSTPLQVNVPEARSDMTAFAMPVTRAINPVAYRGYWTTGQLASAIGSTPTVTVGDGFITLTNYISRLGTMPYSADVDVFLVNT